MAKIVDLRPNQKLLNSKFEKYQFCSDLIPVKYEKKLQAEILRVELTNSQDSWLEAKLFAFHNHLFKNSYDSTCWFIDKHGGIWKFNIDESLDLICTSKAISNSSTKLIYNPSIGFASKNITIICNGGGTIEFLIENDKIVTNYLFDDVDPGVIFDARFIKESSKLIVAIYKVDEDNGKKISKLTFLLYSYNKNTENSSQTFKIIQKQILKVKKAIESVYIDESGNFFYIISQDQVEFEFDSINPIKTQNEKLENNFKIKIPHYYWSQDEDSLTVYVKIPEKYDVVTAKVATTLDRISVTIGDIILIDGQTAYTLESDLTTWKRKDNTLEVELFKTENGLMWNELIKGDTGGEYLPNETLAAEIHSRLSHLCSDQQESNTQGQPAIGFNSEQLEDCDISGAENILQRVDFNFHKVTHMAILSTNNRILFSDKTPSDQLICLRQDHDGCVWKIQESDNEEWDLIHVQTFPGFGYIEASKTNKKFCISPPDGSFIAIIEHTRHAFVYEKPESSAVIGKQKIVDFGNETSPILGVVAINKNMIILTKNALYKLQVYS